MDDEPRRREERGMMEDHEWHQQAQRPRGSWLEHGSDVARLAAACLPIWAPSFIASWSYLSSGLLGLPLVLPPLLLLRQLPLGPHLDRLGLFSPASSKQAVA